MFNISGEFLCVDDLFNVEDDCYGLFSDLFEETNHLFGKLRKNSSSIVQVKKWYEHFVSRISGIFLGYRSENFNKAEEAAIKAFNLRRNLQKLILDCLENVELRHTLEENYNFGHLDESDLKFEDLVEKLSDSGYGDGQIWDQIILESGKIIN